MANNYVQYPVSLNSFNGADFTNNHKIILASIMSGPQGPTGPTGKDGTNGVTGPTGPSGNTTAYIFDGGNSSSSYFLGPAFDCGSSI